ncbi:MAG: rhodanese-like domain-containing protein [Dehalococcoidia bacterium]|nr:MAG: rhodanese-like domain-containing protein [Dehalococcoidia bacterium]
MKRLLLVSAVIIMAFAAACGGGSSGTTAPSTTASSTAMLGTPVAVEGGGTYWSITPAQLHSMSPNDLFIVDADTAYMGEIANTSLFINSDTVSQNLDKFPSDKATKIVVYCAAGVKSKVVAATLVTAGYTRVMQLEGGIIAWQLQGYPATNKTRTMT